MVAVLFWVVIDVVCWLLLVGCFEIGVVFSGAGCALFAGCYVVCGDGC